MSMVEKIMVHVEFVPGSSGVTRWARDTYAYPSRLFTDVVLEVLKDFLVEDKETVDLNWTKYTVYLNRPANTPFFPIAANDQQIAAFRESLADPPHESIDQNDCMLTIGEMLEKYKSAIFTIYEN
jgi:hypothetical protein